MGVATAFDTTDDRPRPPLNPILWLIEACWQYKWLIVAIVATGIVGSAALALRLPDVYTASGLVEIDPEVAPVLPEERRDRFVPPETITETEVEVIRAPNVLRNVVDDLDLEFSAVNPVLNALARADVGLDRNAARSAIVNELGRNLSVRPTGRSFVVEVSYTSRDPDFSADVVNAVMREYLGVRITEARDFSREAATLLSDRLAGLRAELERRERALQDFRSQSRIAESAGTTILVEQIARLNEELIRAQAALAEAAATASSSERASDLTTLPQVVNSTLIQKLREQEAEQSRTVDELETLYRPTHPRLIQARSALDALRETIALETRKITQSLTTSEEVQAQRVLALEGEVDTLRDRLNTQREAEIELRRLEREVEASRKIYEAFLDRINQVESTTGFERPEGRIIAAAAPPVAPSGPNRKIVVAGGLVLSGALAAALVIGLALVDNRLRTTADVARVSGVTPIAVIPPMPRDRSRWRPRTNARFADAITQLRAATLLGSSRPGDLVVAVTSPDESTDCAEIATALSQAAAVAGDVVVLLDADFTEPRVNRILGTANEFGLSDVVMQRADLGAAIHHDPASSLLFVPAGTRANKTLYRDEGMEVVIETFAELFDTIIVNLPPIPETVEAEQLAILADILIVVVRANYTTRKELDDLMALMSYSDFGGRIATVLVRG